MKVSFALLPLAFAIAHAELNLPSLPVLPLGGLNDIFLGNGFNSLANTLQASAQSLSVKADAITSATSQLSVNGTTRLPAVDLTKVIFDVTNVFWQTATEVEKKVCNIALSINQQNIAAQIANLIVGINAQVAAIIKIQATIVATLAKVAQQIAVFTESEKAIFIAAVLSLVNSAQSSIAPVVTLIDGLRAVGISGFAVIVANLQASVSSLSSTISNAQLSYVPSPA